MKANRSWWKMLLGIIIFFGIGYSVYQYNNRPDLYFYAETGHDETEIVTLPDSSKVAMNELSVLVYRESPIWRVRNIDFRGEGFFEVVPYGVRPFIIKTRLANVSVLGTSFNIKAKPDDDDITVSVKNGKVRFHPFGSKEGMDLEEDEEGYFTWENKTMLKRVRGKNTLDWQVGI